MTASSGTAQGTARADNLPLIFQEVLTAIVRVRSNRQELTDAESFRYSMREAIRTAIQDAKNQGYSAEDIRMATLALVGFLDESVLNTQNPLFAEWPRKPLQEELFGIHMAGELFFQNVNQLLNRQDSADLADLLEIHYLCLLLGYSGRYSLGGSGELKTITDTVGERIRRIRGASPDPFIESQPDQEVNRQSTDPWVKRLSIGALVCFGLMVVLFAIFKIVLGSGASAITQLTGMRS
jgi:type VI secretion system protein ImpK